MTRKSDEGSKIVEPPREDEKQLRGEIDRLNRELRAFVAVALQHGLRDYCVTRHPTITAELEQSHISAHLKAKQKYDKVLGKINRAPGLQGATGDTARRTYYRNAQDNVAYVEHALKNKRFLLGGIWVAPHYRGNGYAHGLLRVLVKAADEVDLSIELYHEPFGEEGLGLQELEAFYNRHGFTRHVTSTGKAFTSASMGRDTAGLAGFIGANPENGGLRDMDSRLVIQAGGLPIKIGGALVGGIGVGGAPSGAIDEICARAGLDAIDAE